MVLEVKHPYQGNETFKLEKTDFGAEVYRKFNKKWKSIGQVSYDKINDKININIIKLDDAFQSRGLKNFVINELKKIENINQVSASKIGNPFLVKKFKLKQGENVEAINIDNFAKIKTMDSQIAELTKKLGIKGMNERILAGDEKAIEELLIGLKEGKIQGNYENYLNISTLRGIFYLLQMEKRQLKENKK